MARINLAKMENAEAVEALRARQAAGKEPSRMAEDAESEKQWAQEAWREALRAAVVSSDARWAQEAIDAGASAEEDYLFFIWWSDARHQETHPARTEAMAAWLDARGEPLGFFEPFDQGFDSSGSKGSMSLDQAREALAGGPLDRRKGRLATAVQWSGMAQYRSWEPVAMVAVLAVAARWEDDPVAEARVSREEMLDAMADSLCAQGPQGMRAIGMASKVFGIDIGPARWGRIARGIAKRPRGWLAGEVEFCLESMQDATLCPEAAGMAMARACFEGHLGLALQVAARWEGEIDWAMPEEARVWARMCSKGKKEEAGNGPERLSAWHLCRFGQGNAQERGYENFKSDLLGALLDIPGSLAMAVANPCPEALAHCSLAEIRRLSKSHPKLLAPDHRGRTVAHAWTSRGGGEAHDNCARLLDAKEKLDGVWVGGSPLALSSMVGMADHAGESARSLLEALPSNPKSAGSRERFEKAWTGWERRELGRLGKGGAKPAAAPRPRL